MFKSDVDECVNRVLELLNFLQMEFSVYGPGEGLIEKIYRVLWPTSLCQRSTASRQSHC